MAATAVLFAVDVCTGKEGAAIEDAAAGGIEATDSEILNRETEFIGEMDGSGTGYCTGSSLRIEAAGAVGAGDIEDEALAAFRLASASAFALAIFWLNEAKTS